MKPAILLVDDDLAICDVLRDALSEHVFAVTVSHSGNEALMTIAEQPAIALVLLDMMLPDINGLQVLQHIQRQRPDLPVIMLTGLGSESDVVVGLEMGADDYVTKPFSPRELIARVKALLRRAEPPVDSPRILEIGRLAIDPASYRVSHAGKAVPLSTLEFRLLYYLASRPNRVFTRDQLLDAVWGTDRFVTPRSVDVYVRRLREKIESDPENPLHLKTVRGAGYLFETRAA